MSNYKKISFILGTIIMSVIAGYLAFAWTEPTAAPPGANVSAPLHVGHQAQAKVGGLILNTGGADAGLIVQHGNVGIGTTDPAGRLHVVGGRTFLADGASIGTTNTFRTLTAADEIHSTGISSGFSLTDRVDGDSAARRWVMFANDNGLHFWTEVFGTRMTVTRDGNVGIGTAAPAARLHVVGRARMDEFQLGTAATPGHVLTANAAGVGPWQPPAPGPAAILETRFERCGPLPPFGPIKRCSVECPFGWQRSGCSIDFGPFRRTQMFASAVPWGERGCACRATWKSDDSTEDALRSCFVYCVRIRP
jgi:hypothetical protein